MRYIKVLIAVCLLVLPYTVVAQDDEVGLVVGGASLENEGSINPDNLTVGLTYRLNRFTQYGITPRADLDYIQVADYKEIDSLIKASINGVYEVALQSKFLPYVVAGMGYEFVPDDINNVLDSNFFAQMGLGVVYHQIDGYNFTVEGKSLQILGAKDQDNEIMFTTGVSVPLSKFRKQVEKENCPRKIEGADEDRDGVTDVMDQCPYTPCYFSVDAYGCPIKATLRIHFEVDKATIRPYSMTRIENFANYLLANKGTRVKIIGHTDSDGSDAYNMILSEKRAKAVMEALIKLGVSPNRLSAIGKGKSMPVAPNDTEYGKSLNRRIEVELTYPSN